MGHAVWGLEGVRLTTWQGFGGTGEVTRRGERTWFLVQFSGLVREGDARGRRSLRLGNYLLVE
jgi:hypothetical protein